ncbi:MAG: hypothetical protein V1495_00425 [Pseudomonadota bacterium]
MTGKLCLPAALILALAFFACGGEGENKGKSLNINFDPTATPTPESTATPTATPTPESTPESTATPTATPTLPAPSAPTNFTLNPNIKVKPICTWNEFTSLWDCSYSLVWSAPLSDPTGAGIRYKYSSAKKGDVLPATSPFVDSLSVGSGSTKTMRSTVTSLRGEQIGAFASVTIQCGLINAAMTCQVYTPPIDICPRGSIGGGGSRSDEINPCKDID